MMNSFNAKHLLLGLAVGISTTMATAQTAHASTLMYASTYRNNSTVGLINQVTGEYQTIGNTPFMTDIALTDSGALFGITSSHLYSINTDTGVSTSIGRVGANMVSLGFTDEGRLYGAGGNGFYEIDVSTGQTSLVSAIPGFYSTGDVVFDSVNRRFLGTSGGASVNSLWSIELDGRAAQIGSIGYGHVIGLAFSTPETLLGYTGDGKQLSIDLATGQGLFLQNISNRPGFLGGAASSPTNGKSIEPTSVPEPSSVLGILALGALGVGSLRQRK
ncbi:PEP-CTERM sorting domain-containing protein [Roseofilum sp. Guam]|uniref:PEP-CTERM sorting domain-containing protein n=1 Tax=Roseofilum sp. Guam TaxID=2821502 RepID=UPI001B03FF0A|nr:PEP-CTERM sorting domain-containing protein [Roseofilum sp. Guam]MBP0027378.1 PEP-CTERM sorting domain-containing protein [Roseofilum sp. Guam]